MDNSMPEEERQPRFITGLIRGIGILESALIAISGLVIGFVMVVSVASALSGGDLLRNNQQFNTVFGIAQGVGLEATYIALCGQIPFRWMRGDRGVAVFYTVLVLSLGSVAVMAGAAVNYQQSFKTDFATALQNIGVSQDTWVWARQVVLVALGGIAAITRPRERKKQSLEHQLREIEEQKAINAAKEGLNKQRLKGLISTARGAVLSVRGQEELATEVDGNSANDATDNAVNPGDRSAENTDNQGGQLTAMMGRNRPTGLRSLRRYNPEAEWWSVKEFQAWLWEDRGIKLGDNQARQFIESRCEGEVIPRRAGKPMGAMKNRIIAEARKVYPRRKTHGDQAQSTPDPQDASA